MFDLEAVEMVQKKSADLRNVEAHVYMFCFMPVKFLYSLPLE